PPFLKQGTHTTIYSALSFVSSHHLFCNWLNCIVDQNIDVPPDRALGSGIAQKECPGQGENRRHDASVDVHLPENQAVRLHVDRHRREHGRNGGGGGEHVAEQLQRCRCAIRGDTAHVPSDGVLCVEVGRDDGQTPSLGVFGGNPGEHGPTRIS